MSSGASLTGHGRGLPGGSTVTPKSLERLRPAWRVASPKLHRQLQLTSQPILPSTSLCNWGRIVYQWLGGVAQVRVHDPLHPSFFEGMSTVTKFYLDGLLQVGTADLMQTEAVLL